MDSPLCRGVDGWMDSSSCRGVDGWMDSPHVPHAPTTLSPMLCTLQNPTTTSTTNCHTHTHTCPPPPCSDRPDIRRLPQHPDHQRGGAARPVCRPGWHGAAGPEDYHHTSPGQHRPCHPGTHHAPHGSHVLRAHVRRQVGRGVGSKGRGATTLLCGMDVLLACLMYPPHVYCLLPVLGFHFIRCKPRRQYMWQYMRRQYMRQYMRQAVHEEAVYEAVHEAGSTGGRQYRMQAVQDAGSA